MIAGEEITDALAVYSMYMSGAHRSMNPTKYKLAVLPVAHLVWFLMVVLSPHSIWAMLVFNIFYLFIVCVYLYLCTGHGLLMGVGVFSLFMVWILRIKLKRVRLGSRHIYPLISRGSALSSYVVVSFPSS